MSQSAAVQRLKLWMQYQNLDHLALARRMKFSPTYCFGVLNGNWQPSADFKWSFAEAFGLPAAASVWGIPAQSLGEDGEEPALQAA